MTVSEIVSCRYYMKMQSFDFDNIVVPRDGLCRCGLCGKC